jgi:hypothetical protein
MGRWISFGICRCRRLEAKWLVVRNGRVWHIVGSRFNEPWLCSHFLNCRLHYLRSILHCTAPSLHTKKVVFAPRRPPVCIFQRSHTAAMPRFGRHTFAFHTDAAMPEHPESSKKEIKLKPRTTISASRTHKRQKDEPSALQTVLENLATIYMVACLALKRLSAHVPTAHLRSFRINITEYLRAAAECVWYYMLACITLTVFVTTLVQTIIVVWKLRWSLFVVVTGRCVCEYLYNTGIVL